MNKNDYYVCTKKWSDLMVMKNQTFVLEILNGENIMYMSMHHL
jgi:hypothetical protein